jgi:hypothetical protein
MARGGVFRRRDPVAYRSRRQWIAGPPSSGKTVALTEAVAAVAAVPPVTVSGDATIILVDAVDAVAAVPAVTVTAETSATIVLTDAVDAIASIPGVTLSSINVDTIDAPPLIGPLITTGADQFDIGTIDGSHTPIGPLWIATDDSNPATPTVTARLFESDGTTEIANALDNAFDIMWLDEINSTGYGVIRLPLSDTAGVAELTLGRMVRLYIGGVAAFTWQIEVPPTREEIARGEEHAQVMTTRGRGWASTLDDAVVYPAIPVLESEADLASPFLGLDRVFSFASPDFPNDTWDNAIKQYEYSELQSYRFQTVETEEDVFENLPAPVGMPYPNSQIYDGLVDPIEQKAYWIWPNANAYQEGFAFFRGILVDPPLREMSIETTSENLFTLFVDGIPVLGENDDLHMWQGWKDVTVDLPTSRYYTFGCVVENVFGVNPSAGGWLLASHYPDDEGTPEVWALTSNHLWTAHYSATTWPGWTAGQIVNQLITEAINRSALEATFLTWFTAWTDSLGLPWNVDINNDDTPYIPWFPVRVGTTTLQALEKLHMDGWVDWRMGGGGLVLEMFSADSPSRDSLATFTAGTNIVELDREYDRPLANALLTYWANGLIEVRDDASIAASGRREDMYNTSAASEEEATRLATVELNFRSLDTEGGGISMAIEPDTEANTPYISFLPGDSVTIPSLDPITNPTGVLLRVMSIMVEQDELGNPVFTLELNRKLPVRERDTNRLLREMGGKTLGAAGLRGSL